MIGIDTNILLRYVVKDDSAQAQKAAALIDSATEDNPVFINSVVLAEFVWVLERGYRYARKQIHATLEGLLIASELVFEDPEAVHHALHHYEQGGPGFSDLLLARINKLHGCKITKTFDVKAGEADDFETV